MLQSESSEIATPLRTVWPLGSARFQCPWCSAQVDASEPATVRHHERRECDPGWTEAEITR